jgi:hypothetical protein
MKQKRTYVVLYTDGFEIEYQGVTHFVTPLSLVINTSKDAKGDVIEIPVVLIRCFTVKKLK